MRWMSDRHRELYQTSAWFRMAVDQLVPVLLDGLAARADELAEETEERLRQLQEAPPGRFTIDPDGLLDPGAGN